MRRIIAYIRKQIKFSYKELLTCLLAFIVQLYMAVGIYFNHSMLSLENIIQLQSPTSEMHSCISANMYMYQVYHPPDRIRKHFSKVTPDQEKFLCIELLLEIQ